MTKSPMVFGLSLSKTTSGVWLVMMITGLSVVLSSHHCRLLYGELASLEQEKNQLQVAWGQYLLQESSLASLHRIETLARNKLKMHVPSAHQIVVVEP